MITSCVVIKWNLLEGYQGLRELAESSDEVWNTARNQEIAGGLSNRALVRSWEETAGTHRGPGLNASSPSSPLRTTHSSCRGLERTPGCPGLGSMPSPWLQLEQTERKPALLPPWRRWGHPHPPHPRLHTSWSRRRENRYFCLRGGGGGTRTPQPQLHTRAGGRVSLGK